MLYCSLHKIVQHTCNVDCTLPTGEQGVKVSDTTGLHSSNAAKFINMIVHFYTGQSINMLQGIKHYKQIPV